MSDLHPYAEELFYFRRLAEKIWRGEELDVYERQDVCIAVGRQIDDLRASTIQGVSNSPERRLDNVDEL